MMTSILNREDSNFRCIKYFMTIPALNDAINNAQRTVKAERSIHVTVIVAEVRTSKVIRTTK